MTVRSCSSQPTSPTLKSSVSDTTSGHAAPAWIIGGEDNPHGSIERPGLLDVAFAGPGTLSHVLPLHTP